MQYPYVGNNYTYRGSIHNHTVHSDGTGTIEDLIAAAAKTKLDFLIITDHNVLVDQTQQGWRQGVLTLLDSEIHDPDLVPERNHCLTLNISEDMTPYGKDPQGLIDAVRERGGLTFLAHPIDPPGKLIPECFPWTEWDIEGFTGVELWNFMSEFRPYATSKAKAVVMAFFPQLFTTGPWPEMLAKWDELLQKQPTVAIGGPDAHAQVYRLGPLRRRFLPYDYCFRAVNTHIVVPRPFSGDVEHDRRLVYEALGAGRAWVGYDLLHATEGFEFIAESPSSVIFMGESASLAEGPILRVHTPAPGHIKLIRAGSGIIAEGHGQELTFRPVEPGAYRVEVWKRWWFKSRGWIFSNPIYVR